MLGILGPASIYLGEDVRATGRLSAGVNDFFNSALVGYLDGLAYARSAGVPLDVFMRTAENRLITLREYLSVCTRQASNGSYEAELSNVHSHLDGLTAQLRTLEGAGASQAMGEAAAAYMRRAVDAGVADKETAVLVELLRPS